LIEIFLENIRTLKTSEGLFLEKEKKNFEAFSKLKIFGKSSKIEKGGKHLTNFFAQMKDQWG